MIEKSALTDLLSGCPIIVVYAETGTGKTKFTSTVMEDPRYAKTLFIDGDRGGATVAHLTSRPELCDYRRPDNAVNALMVQQWICRQIAGAHKVPDVGSIIIEGLARVYQDSVGEEFSRASAEDLIGHRLRRFYIVPSGLVKSIITLAGNLQLQLLKAGRSVPIILTCNTKEKTDDNSGRSWQIPAISDSTTKMLMGNADAFVQLRRSGTTTSILTDRDQYTTARKVRHHGAALAIAKLRNPTLPTMLQTWADATTASAAEIDKALNETDNS
jgi:hypothetical protein